MTALTFARAVLVRAFPFSFKVGLDARSGQKDAGFGPALSPELPSKPPDPADWFGRVAAKPLLGLLVTPKQMFFRDRGWHTSEIIEGQDLGSGVA
jgi:hypothetical protein